MNKIQFPTILNYNGKLLADELKPEKPLSLEEAANGRTIKQYPFKFDDFNSIDDLKEHIKLFLQLHPNAKKQWLDLNRIVNSTLNVFDDVYYTDVNSINISCNKPNKNVFDDIVIGCGLNLHLNPIKWKFNDVQKLIEEIKNNI